MFDLTRQEKTILVFLTSAFVVGLGINTYKKTKEIKLDVRPYKMTVSQEAADKFIAEERLININSLEIEELSRLPGVGVKLAERIIEYHRTRGPFRNKEELIQVKGIGRKKFEDIKDLIILK